MHKAEVEIRDVIGVEHMTFGRDYPHAEGTWPNTFEYLHDLFTGVPEADVRKILGENAIRYFGLDAEKIGAIAQKVGPTVEQLTGDAPAIDPLLVAHLDARSGYLKPAERGTRLGELDELLHDDLARYAASAPQ
jgi:hypothetical protein